MIDVDRYTAPTLKRPAGDSRRPASAPGDPVPVPGYHRDATTWAAFGALFAFGFFLSVLGPVLPYIRGVEHISYVVGALHQAASAIGGGLAGLLASRDRNARSRTTVIAVGLIGAGIAGLALGYGDEAVITIPAALLVGLLATSALVRIWGIVADRHGARRAVAMSEGEVAVSLAGILTPLLIGALAATALSWRFAFVIGAGTAVLAVLGISRAHVPPPASGHDGPPAAHARPDRAWLQPTLLVIFAIVALEFSLSFWLASYLNDDIGLPRGAAVVAVSGLYASNLVGRVLASRLARHIRPDRLLAAALGTALLGLPFLLSAGSARVAVVGIVVTGIGIGAMFPLTSALHVEASPLTADGALGQVLAVAAPGQLAGPLIAGAIAQAAGLRAGLFVLPVLILLATVGLVRTRRRIASPRVTPGACPPGP